MAALESAAAQESYQETWSIPNGQTFRVSGKPHPNGAIAFLLEDISDEVSLTRKFRSQIDVGNAVIDNLEAAVCVFSSSGTMVMANAAYQSLWGTELEGAISVRDFAEESANWQEATTPSPVWVKLHEAISLGKAEASWRGSVWLDGHVKISCQYNPLLDGNHQVTFHSCGQRKLGPRCREDVGFKTSTFVVCLIDLAGNSVRPKVGAWCVQLQLYDFHLKMTQPDSAKLSLSTRGAGDCFLLRGQIGAGKSALARAFIRSLLGPETEVPSPNIHTCSNV